MGLSSGSNPVPKTRAGNQEDSSAGDAGRFKSYDDLRLERDTLKTENAELKREIERLHANALKSGSSKFQSVYLGLDQGNVLSVDRIKCSSTVLYCARLVVSSGGLGGAGGRPKSKAQMVMLANAQMFKKRKGASALNPRMKKYVSQYLHLLDFFHVLSRKFKNVVYDFSFIFYRGTVAKGTEFGSEDDDEED